MPIGFFTQSEMAASKPPVSRIPKCGSCGLWKLCKSPKMSVSGKGQKKILIVGEAPGENEDKENRQFCGVTGRKLEAALASVGINMRRDCWLTNSLICRPPKNAAPTSNQIDYCNTLDAPIWMADLSFKPLGDVKVGDKVVGWTRIKVEGKVGIRSKRKLVRATVTDVRRRIANVVAIQFESGKVIRCTADHKWLAGKHTWMNNKEYFKPASVGEFLNKVVEPVEELPSDLSYHAGYIGAMLDAEGHCELKKTQKTGKIYIAQSVSKNPQVCDQIRSSLTQLGLDHNWIQLAKKYAPEVMGAVIKGGIDTEVKLLNWCKPAKWSKRLKKQITKRTNFMRRDKVVSITPCGKEEVACLTTTSGNYIAWGYASKNCRPNLIRTIEDLKPEIIILVGGAAIESLISWVWKDKVGRVERWIGWHIPSQKLNAWICPIWHPSFVSRTEHEGKHPEVPIIWREHLRQIGKLSGRPWDVVPNYKKQVRIILEADEAVKEIEKIIATGGYAAFDYETNTLKPEWEEARIVCCSICQNGDNTISFPWSGAVVEPMRRFVRSPIKKIASNLKFEDRWSVRFLRSAVRKWFWCTMLGGHISDNRRGISSIKFQSFVWLGADSYNDHIVEQLKAKGESKVNNVIREVEIGQLLTYCGLDSLLEYHTCFKQRKAMNYDSD